MTQIDNKIGWQVIWRVCLCLWFWQVLFIVRSQVNFFSHHIAFLSLSLTVYWLYFFWGQRIHSQLWNNFVNIIIFLYYVWSLSLCARCKNIFYWQKNRARYHLYTFKFMKNHLMWIKNNTTLKWGFCRWVRAFVRYDPLEPLYEDLRPYSMGWPPHSWFYHTQWRYWASVLSAPAAQSPSGTMHNNNYSRERDIRARGQPGKQCRLVGGLPVYT